ncbi:hypothetical protein ACFP1Z_09245 [Streptomyces gamaensis]|uniref:Uncharacterized protein n=1 Tax=Streptomyces gamaensis TaxID=1763542 RepID=A0ABW0Z1U9_9ACTN
MSTPVVSVTLVDELPGGRKALLLEREGAFELCVARDDMSEELRDELALLLQSAADRGALVQRWGGLVEPPQQRRAS